MRTGKIVVFLFLWVLLLLPVFSQQTAKGDSVVKRDSIRHIDTLIRIDTVVLIDTVRLPAAVDSSVAKQEPTFILIDSTSNGMTSFNDALNSLNPFRQIGFPKIALIVFIVLVASGLSAAVSSVRRYTGVRKEFTPGWRRILPVINWIIWFLAIFLILRLVFVQTQVLMIFILILLSVITGVASLSLIRNILGRLFILSGNMFSIDDYIKTSIAKGFVKEIGWKNITIFNDEGSAIFIPNSYFIENSFENVSRGKKEELVSLDFDFPSTYDHSLIIRILKDAAISNPFLFVNSEPEVFIKNVDFLNCKFTVRVNMFLYDSAYIDELYDSMNQSVLKKLRPYRSEMDINVA